MNIIVAAIGGSLLRPEVEEKHVWLENLISIIRERVALGDRVGLVVGGGAPAREGITLAKPLITDTNHLDKIGIAATRLNATIVRETFAEAGISVSGIIPSSINEAIHLLEERPVVIMGGTEPGHTTDAVAIRFAIAANAKKCIIATNVGNVFAEDPEHKEAGASSVVDAIAVSEASKSNLEINIIDGRKTELIKLAMIGSDFEGTRIS